MVRNRNGYWMSPKFFGMCPGESDAGNVGGVGGGTGAPAGEGTPGGEGGTDAGNADNGTGAGQDGASGNGSDNDAGADNTAEIARLKAEIARQKAALDKATHEASEAKKSLKAKMTQEEIDAQAKQEAAEKAAQELDDLRKQVAKGNTVKTVMGKLGLDEASAGNLADHLYGAADIENALLEIQKAWQAREAALRKEYGKVTGPGAGADSNSPEAKAVRMASELGKAQNARNEQAQKALNAYMR